MRGAGDAIGFFPTSFPPKGKNEDFCSRRPANAAREG
jgi:hypothetical protein